jgi:hypothetical protein
MQVIKTADMGRSSKQLARLHQRINDRERIVGRSAARDLLQRVGPGNLDLNTSPDSPEPPKSL